jgi:hypothetical protein
MRYAAMITLGMMMLLACKSAGPDRSPEVARVTVKKYAYEAFAQWSINNPGSSCPATIADLAPFAGSASKTDPWGNEYLIFCGDSLPAGAKNFAVQSAGPDGKRDTADDIKSWE